MQFKISKRFPHLEVSRWGVVRRIKDKKVLTVNKPTKAGYLRLTGTFEGKRYNVFIHSLVAEVWVSGYKEGLVVNHKDGNKLNNHADNLEWITQAENVKHAQLNDLSVSKFGVEKIKNICRLLEKGLKNSDISKIENVPTYLVSDIKGGKWANIAKDFKIPKPKDKPSESAIHWICQKIVDGWKNKDIEKQCPFPNVSRSTVSGVRNKLYYPEITQQYF